MRKIKFSVVAVLVLMVLCAKVQAQESVAKGRVAIGNCGLWGVVDATDSTKWIVLPKYDKVWKYSKDRALFSFKGKYGYLDINGKEILEPKFESASNFSPDGLAMVQLESKYGFIDVNGNFKIQNNLDWAEAFSQGVAAVQKDGEYYFIKPNGTPLSNKKYDYVRGFKNGVAVVNIKDNYGLIDLTGKEITAIKFKFVDDAIADNNAVVAIMDNKYILLNKQGAVIDSVGYDKILEASEGKYLVKDKDKYFYINKDGVKSKEEFVMASTFKNGLAFVSGKKGKWDIIDTTFKKINKKGYSQLKRAEFGRVLYLKGCMNGWGVLDNKGGTVLKPKSDYIHTASNGIYRTTSFGKYRFYSYDGTKKSKKFLEAEDFNSGVAIVKAKKKEGYRLLNKEMSLITEGSYLSINSFEKDTVTIAKKKSGEFALLSNRGEEKFVVSYDSVTNPKGGLIKFKKDGRYGFISLTGEEVVPASYEMASDFSLGYAKVFKDGEYGFIDTVGKVFVPFEYTQATSFCDGYAKVFSSDKDLEGYIDLQGKFILERK